MRNRYFSQRYLCPILTSGLLLSPMAVTAQPCAEALAKILHFNHVIRDSIEVVTTRTDSKQAVENENLRWNALSFFDNQTGQSHRIQAKDLFLYADLQSFSHTGFGIIDFQWMAESKTLIAVVVRDWASKAEISKFEVSNDSHQRVMLVALDVWKIMNASKKDGLLAYQKAIEAAVMARIPIRFPNSESLDYSISTLRNSTVNSDIILHLTHKDAERERKIRLRLISISRDQYYFQFD